MNRPKNSSATGHRTLLLVLALMAAGVAHHNLVTVAYAACPWPDSQLCGLGPKVFETDTCGAQATQLMPIPGTYRSFGDPPQHHKTWLKATSLSYPIGPSDNQVIGTHSHVTFKTLSVLDVPQWNDETHYWDADASVIYVMRQELLNGGQAAAAIFARRPSTFVPANGPHPAHHRTDLTAVAYYPGAGHGKITRKVFSVNDSGDDFDELELLFRLRARPACIYAYHTPQLPECRFVEDLYWEFLWAHENDWGPDGSQRYNHDGTDNYIRFLLAPQLIFPVTGAYHGVEVVGTGEPRVQLHIGSDNNRKYFFSACNCLDHCQTDGSPPQPCGCKPDGFYGWQASFPDNIPEWGDLSAGPIEVGMDVFAPDKWMLPNPENDPSEAVFDVCYNSVPNTPCECTAGETRLAWVDPRRQEEQNWCWAAASQSLIKNMRDQEPEQEAIVRLGWCSEETRCVCAPCPAPMCHERPCCDTSTLRSKLVYAAGWPCASRAVWSAFGIAERAWHFGQPGFYDIIAEIGSGRPVYLIWQWDPFAYHAMLITGYWCGPEELMHVYNIDGGSGGRTSGKWLPYDTIEESIGRGQWFMTFVFE